MPGGDRTGPEGAGPMTGRGAGFCANQERQGNSNPSFGRGFSWNCGFGRGSQGRGRQRRNQYFATAAKSAGGLQYENLNDLNEQYQYLKRQLQEIETRVNEIRRNIEKTDQD